MVDGSMTVKFDLRVHEELLLQIVRADPDLNCIRDLLTHSEFEWEPFWDLARDQQVQPLVANVLANQTLTEALSDAARNAIKIARLQMTINNLSNHAELEAIVARLRDRGIPAVPLKGTHLALRVLGALDARRCGDIDILVPENDREMAYQILIDSGYRPNAVIRPGVKRHTFHDVPLVRWFNGRPFQVEVHWKITDPRFLTIDHQALWCRIAQHPKAPNAPISFDLPSDELLVFLATHIPKHSDGTLRLLADIDHLIAHEGDRLDWDHVVQLAKEWHADGLLYFVLTLSALLLSTCVPQDALRKIQPPALKRAIIPLLVGPQVILRPPAMPNLRDRRFRIAYCLMLRGGSEVRSYWHYIMMPPQISPEKAWSRLTQPISRPVDGLVWTALVFGSALRDRYRPRISAQT